MFTIHCPANRTLEVKESKISKEEFNLKKIEIPASLKLDVENMLDDYGINSSTLFPDLDGLSKHIDRETEKMVLRTAT